MTDPSRDRVERLAVRVVLIDLAHSVLLLSTRDASNPAFGVSRELPSGGIAHGERIPEAAVREIREETGFQLTEADIGEPLWHRDVFYTYRGERRLQREVICLARVPQVAPGLQTAGREAIEHEDHLN